MGWPGTIENIATMVAATATTLGLYAMGAGGWAAVGLIFLLNMNTGRKKGGGDGLA
jgi:hypothetical protein